MRLRNDHVLAVRAHSGSRQEVRPTNQEEVGESSAKVTPVHFTAIRIVDVVAFRAIYLDRAIA